MVNAKIALWIKLGWIKKDNDLFQIRSQTNKNTFYVIHDNECDCKGFRYRQKCFHLDVKEEFCKAL